MNLLEHYIIKIISEREIQDPKDGRKYYRVNAIVDCWGQKEEINRLFLANVWERAKVEGFFMA